MKSLKEFVQWLEEETEEFSIEKLKTFGTEKVSHHIKNQLFSYISKHLGNPKWGGDFRYAWPLDENKVLKLAKNLEGVEQNKLEYKNSQCMGSKYAVQVLDHHHQFYWLIEERLGQLEDNEFYAAINKKLGTNFGDRVMMPSGISIDSTLVIIGIIIDMVQKRRRAKYQEFYPYFENSEWFLGLVGVLEGCTVGYHDFHSGNWGIRPSTGELVILDLGF